MKTPRAHENIQLRSKDIRQVAQILDDLKSSNVDGLKLKQTVLKKTMIVNLITIWETYVEDIVVEATDFIAANSKDTKKIPNSTLVIISDNLITQKDKRVIWNISGDGWRQLLRDNTSQIIERFHTPKPSNIDALLLKTIGMKSISSSWKWKGKTNSSVKKQLNHWVTRRGEIVHQIITTDSNGTKLRNFKRNADWI